MARLIWPKRTTAFIAAASAHPRQWFSASEVCEIVQLAPTYVSEIITRWAQFGLVEMKVDERARAFRGGTIWRRLRVYRPSAAMVVLAVARERPDRCDARESDPVGDRIARVEARFAARMAGRRYEDVPGARPRPFVRMPSAGLAWSPLRSAADMCAES